MKKLSYFFGLPFHFLDKMFHKSVIQILPSGLKNSILSNITLPWTCYEVKMHLMQIKFNESIFLFNYRYLKKQTTVTRKLLKKFSILLLHATGNGKTTFFFFCSRFLTFKASSSKHCSTFSRVLALHSRNKHPCSVARAIPSSLLTTLSDSCHAYKM